MANSEIINLIISTVAEMVIYLMPVTALLAGLIFIFSVLYEFTIGAVRNIRQVFMSEESGREWMIDEFAEIGYTEEEIDSLLEEASDDF